MLLEEEDEEGEANIAAILRVVVVVVGFTGSACRFAAAF